MSRPAPSIFVPHGGGPWPILPLPPLPQDETDALLAYMRSIRDASATPLRGLLVVSAHWEQPVATVNTAPAPAMLYDYGGFPPDAYKLDWPAPGAPDLARRAAALLEAAGFQTAQNDTRGYDHGVFIPLMAAWPEPDLPVAQLSLLRSLDPVAHLAMGRALAPLRDDGIMIVGSGNSFHDLRAFFHQSPDAATASQRFDAWLAQTVALPPTERDARLARWADAPAARQCHPREEHLLPLMVVAGAAGNDRGRVAWTGTFGGNRISALHFG